jgi:hypothetical protein
LINFSIQEQNNQTYREYCEENAPKCTCQLDKGILISLKIFLTGRKEQGRKFSRSELQSKFST